MPKRSLRFRITQDGLVEETVEGVLGSSCCQLTERLEKSLGVVQRRESTPEAYLNPQVQSQSIPVEHLL